MASKPVFRYMLRPLRGPPLLLIGVVCVLQTIARAAGFAGLPLSALLASWVWTYAYLLVDYTAHGRAPPVLAFEMTTPWHEPRPLLQFLLLAGAAALVWWLAERGAAAAAVAVGALTIALFPASLALLAIEGGILRSIWPPALFGVVRGLGLSYLWVIGAALGGAWLLAVAYAHVAPFAWYGLAQFALFALASALGGALYERRIELGIEAWEAPERHAARSEADELKARSRLVDEVYALVRVRELGTAWQRLAAGLGVAPADPQLYRWFRDRTAQWEDRRIADRLTSDLVARLVALGRRGEAVHELEGWWRQGGQFVPRTARDLDVLKRAAGELGHARTLERLAATQLEASAGVENKTADGAS